jgi:hypothetical protein
MDFYPTLVTEYMTVNLALKQKGNVEIFVYDIFGHFYIDRLVSGFTSGNTPNTFTLQSPVILDLGTLPYGMYVLIAQGGGKFILKKFIKAPYQ